MRMETTSGAAISGLDGALYGGGGGRLNVAEHGIKMKAVKFTSTVTDHDRSWSGKSRGYANSYSSQVVVGQVMTANDAWSVFWSRGWWRSLPPMLRRSMWASMWARIATSPAPTRPSAIWSSRRGGGQSGPGLCGHAGRRLDPRRGQRAAQLQPERALLRQRGHRLADRHGRRQRRLGGALWGRSGQRRRPPAGRR